MRQAHFRMRDMRTIVIMDEGRALIYIIKKGEVKTFPFSFCYCFAGVQRVQRTK